MQHADPERAQQRNATIEAMLDQSLTAICRSELLLAQAQERLLRAREHLPPNPSALEKPPPAVGPAGAVFTVSFSVEPAPLSPRFLVLPPRPPRRFQPNLTLCPSR